VLRHFYTFILTNLLCGSAFAEVQTPYIRMKAGYYLTNVSAGNRIQDVGLGAIMTFQPTLLWDFASLSSRIGVHYLGDFGSEYGLIPISGIGLSGYFYPYGITSGSRMTTDNVVVQTYKSGPFIVGGITPVNFNFNQDDEVDPQASISFSALILELLLGVGFDYPLRDNTMVSTSLCFRFGSVAENSSEENVDYSGIGLNFSFTTNYF